MKIQLYSTVIACSLLVCLWGCNKPKADDDDEAVSGNVRVPVHVQSLSRGNIEDAVSAVGETEALRKEKVLSPVAGRIITLNVLEGSQVHKGDVLVVLRTREAQAAVDGAKMLLQSATTDRQREEAEHTLVLTDSLQPRVVLRASFDGTVASRNVMEGELVSEQAELLTLIDPATIMFIAEVPIQNIISVHPGLPAKVHFAQLPLGELNAVVDAVTPQAESQSQSVKVRLRFTGLTAKQEQVLKVNVPGNARIIVGVRRDVLVIGRSALLHDDESDAYSVVIMTPDSLAKIVPVTVGIRSDTLLEIQSGMLHPGDRIITHGQYALADSTRVTVE